MEQWVPCFYSFLRETSDVCVWDTTRCCGTMCQTKAREFTYILFSLLYSIKVKLIMMLLYWWLWSEVWCAFNNVCGEVEVIGVISLWIDNNSFCVLLRGFFIQCTLQSYIYYITFQRKKTLHHVVFSLFYDKLVNTSNWLVKTRGQEAQFPGQVTTYLSPSTLLYRQAFL